MKKTLCLTLAQAEWHIKELIQKGVIKSKNRKAPKKVEISK